MAIVKTHHIHLRDTYTSTSHGLIFFNSEGKAEVEEKVGKFFKDIPGFTLEEEGPSAEELKRVKSKDTVVSEEAKKPEEKGSKEEVKKPEEEKKESK